ncbi:uncharacterized protein [Ovis canadensis]|uniref:uncharacterized protein n=1 Tax=Ovis canadensis TaxID=37174 RepID=UPI0037520F41
MEYVLFVLYFSFFLCLCTLVCLYFSGCQEMTYKHEAAVIGKLLPVPRIIGNDVDEERGGREKPGSAKGLFI